MIELRIYNPCLNQETKRLIMLILLSYRVQNRGDLALGFIQFYNLMKP